MNPREQKNHRTSVTTLAKGVDEFAEATAARFSALSTRMAIAEESCRRQIREERTHRLKLSDDHKLMAEHVDVFLQRGFWSRLNWLVTGR